MCWYSSYIQLCDYIPYIYSYIDMLWIHVYESAWCMHIMLVSSLKSYCWNCTYLLCPLLFLQLEPHILQSNTWVHGIDGFGSSPSINETRNTHADSSCDWIVQMVWYDDHTETLFGSSNHQKPCTVTIIICLVFGSFVSGNWNSSCATDHINGNMLASESQNTDILYFNWVKLVLKLSFVRSGSRWLNHFAQA